jgi:endonuclease YncB( thermonuclease family)
MRTIVLGFALFALADIAAAQATLTGRIVGVADGDTLTLLDAGKQQHRLRLDGIDARETGHAFGSRARQSLSDLAYAREAEAKCAKADRYGRSVCVVSVDGRDVGLE